MSVGSINSQNTMSQNITFSRFAHFDTNILSTFAKNQSLWQPLQDFLKANDLCLAIGEGQFAELNSDDRLHQPLNDLLTAAPSAIVKNHQIILDEEVKAHPGKRTETLLQYPLNALFGTNELSNYLSSAELTEARGEQKQNSQVWMQRLIALQSNFPPDKNGKYTRAQAPFFAWTMTIQELQAEYLSFLQQFQEDVSQFNDESFLSVQIKAYAIFYKYYLTGREPQPTDFGDMFHLHAMPYCKLVVVERNMCEILNQVKRNSHVLNGVVVKNIRFLSDWQWAEETS